MRKAAPARHQSRKPEDVSSEKLLLQMSDVISLREKVAQAELTARVMERLPSEGSLPSEGNGRKKKKKAAHFEQKNRPKPVASPTHRSHR
jgi:hypothetical protein